MSSLTEPVPLQPSNAPRSLHSLPAEVIERILTFSDPRDVSRYSQTCHYAHSLVYEGQDQFLWRELLLGRPFDDPRKAIPVPRGAGRYRRLDANEVAPSSSVTEESAEPIRKADIPWKQELQRRIQAEAIATSGTPDAALLQIAYAAFQSAVETAIPVGEDEKPSRAGPAEDPASQDGENRSVSQSENLRWLDRVLRKTRVLDVVPAAYTGPIVDLTTFAGLQQTAEADATAQDALDMADSTSQDDDSEWEDEPTTDSNCVPDVVRTAQQMRARLRAHVALSHESSFQNASRVRMAVIRKASRAFVYDMRKYQKNTVWGPFRTDPADGRTLLVNWEHVEHVLNVVGLKLREIQIASLGYYKKPLFHLDALRAYSAVGAHERPEGDWAGVTGLWRRFVCFMDYRDLYMFNYSMLPPGPHDPNFFDDPFDEALRPVELHLSLISHEEYFSDRTRIMKDPPGPVTDCDDPAFPTLYFKGHSRGGAHSTDATIRGKVSTLADGAVRWQFVTTYEGRMQWSAEAVQIGHVCSAAGVAGIWTGAHHDRDDPAGPFWMVKVTEELPSSVLNTLH